MIKKCDVLIIGGGLAGCATAYYLARSGVDVLLVESADLNTRASGANAGSIHLQIPHHEFMTLGESWARNFAPVLPMMLQSTELWKQLGAELGRDLEFSQPGGIIVARNAEQLNLVRRKTAVEAKHGIGTRMLSATELRSIAPYISSDMIGGAYCPDEGKANPLVATDAFAAAAKHHGASVMIHATVTALTKTAHGFAAKLQGSGIHARRVVNAAGADAGRIAAMLGVSLPIEGFPLQVSVSEPLKPLVRHLVYSAAGKLTLKQMQNGTCLIGGGWPSRLASNGRLAIDPGSLTANLKTAIAAVPGLQSARIVRTWPAIVNGTADWRPLIGEVPGLRGFYVNMFPWMGFTAGPISALLTAELILGRKPSIDIERISALNG